MNNATYQASIEAAIKRHVALFVYLVTEGGKSNTAAWEIIKSRSTFGPASMAALWDRCLTASIAAKTAAVAA